MALFNHISGGLWGHSVAPRVTHELPKMWYNQAGGAGRERAVDAVLCQVRGVTTHREMT